jgi:hypothetical protein
MREPGIPYIHEVLALSEMRKRKCMWKNLQWKQLVLNPRPLALKSKFPISEHRLLKTWTKIKDWFQVTIEV